MTDVTNQETGTDPDFVSARLPRGWEALLEGYARQFNAPNHILTGAKQLVGSWVRAASDEPPAPIPALLPHDWPAQLTALLDRVNAPNATRQVAFQLVDDWVLAANDAAQAADDVATTGNGPGD